MKEIIEQTKKWIEKVDRDLISAKKLFEAKIYDYCLFHAQQAVKKYLKFLTFKSLL
ncbi:TPA: HEPN domain-containing protein [Candidatus Bathyarchaeota archaeon]|nr:HEPN domain-containing protein [Candidatus Bathyarchaeota archaeon]